MTQWRDTIMIPPHGSARIWVRYSNFTGKTVFHCNFLAHGDTGMMATLFIGNQDFTLRAFLQEHSTNPLFWLGVGLMAVLFSGGLAMMIYSVLGNRSTTAAEAEYAPVALKEIELTG
jgi:hypothetical protein